jgi:hypothetical protein
MRLLGLLLACFSALPAQTAADTEKKTKAREFLEKSALAAGAATTSEVSAIATIHMGRAWRKLDKVRASLYLQEGFTAADALSDENLRDRLQVKAVQILAEVNPGAATNLLRAMPPSDRRAEAVAKVVETLLANKDIDHAIETVTLSSDGPSYPYQAALSIFEKLPDGDGRRTIVFGNALSAYRRREDPAFFELIVKHWKSVPRELAQSAASAAVSGIKARSEEPGNGESLETPNGNVKLGSRKSVDLFGLLPALRELDPAAAKELLTQFADVRAAIAQYPGGRDAARAEATLTSHQEHTGAGTSAGSNLSGAGMDDAMPPFSVFAGDYSNGQDVLREFGAAQRKAVEALEAFKKGESGALSLADDIKMPTVKGALWLEFAKEGADKDPADAARYLDKGEAVTAEIEHPANRMTLLGSIAKVQHKLKRDKEAWTTLEHAIEAVAAMYVLDTKADRPNRAPRDAWPSIQGCRMTVWEATEMFGVRAEALLVGIKDADLALLAQIELAAALLGEELSVNSFEIRYDNPG